MERLKGKPCRSSTCAINMLMASPGFNPSRPRISSAFFKRKAGTLALTRTVFSSNIFMTQICLFVLASQAPGPASQPAGAHLRFIGLTGGTGSAAVRSGAWPEIRTARKADAVPLFISIGVVSTPCFRRVSEIGSPSVATDGPPRGCRPCRPLGLVTRWELGRTFAPVRSTSAGNESHMRPARREEQLLTVSLLKQHVLDEWRLVVAPALCRRRALIGLFLQAHLSGVRMLTLFRDG